MLRVTCETESLIGEVACQRIISVISSGSSIRRLGLLFEDVGCGCLLASSSSAVGQKYFLGTFSFNNLVIGKGRTTRITNGILKHK